MAVAASLLPELEDVVQHGSPQKRAVTLRRITNLFLEGAPGFHQEHVDLFDDVISCLIKESEVKDLAELARSLAPVWNAPSGVVRQLALDDDIAVAGPVLHHPNLAERDLIHIAETMGPPHLLALSSRIDIGEAVTDILVDRGDGEVARGVASNQQARLSESAFAALVNRSGQDSVLAEKLGMRADIPPRLFRELLLQASETVRKRLLANAKPETQAEIRRVLAQNSDEAASAVTPHNYANAVAAVHALHKDRKLTESDVAEFAKSGKYEETIAALAMVCAVPIDVVDRLMSSERTDPVLTLGRAANFSWMTVRAIIMAKSDGKGASNQAIETAFENFERLTPATAQRVVRFWQVRPGTGA